MVCSTRLPVTKPTRPRVLLVDDYDGILKAWRRLLEPSCEIVGGVSNGQDLLRLTHALKPDVIVLDLFMPGANGLDLCRSVKEGAPATHIILVSGTDDEDIRSAALELGAAAFVWKYAPVQELEAAIRRAYLNESAPPPATSLR
jgi:two-component system NarL family response regulator